jgi:hypothetical protein
LIPRDGGKMRKNDADYNIKLMEKIDDIIKKEFNNISDEQILYHYTNASSLISIIENKEFWISQRDFMNDKYEIKYPFEQFLEIFKKNKTISYNPDYYIENHLSSLHNQYILSFSLLPDSLHQWSYYGKNDGYCLGIKKGNLIKLLTELKIEFSCGKVIYNKNIYEPLLKKIINFLDTFNGSGLKAYIDHSVLFEYEDILNILLSCIKQEYNSLENEYRFMIMGDKKYFRAKNGLIIPFSKLKLEPMPIEEIIIGPRISDELVENGLKQLCDDNNIKNVKIKHSMLKIR